MRGLTSAAFATCRPPSAPRLSPMTGCRPSADARLGLLAGVGRRRGAVRPAGGAASFASSSKLAADAGAVGSAPVAVARRLCRRARRGGVLVLEEARDGGLIVEDNDPLLRIEACPGAPDCARAASMHAATRAGSATIAAAHGFTGSIHVSGCAKGCARSRRPIWCWSARPARYRRDAQGNDARSGRAHGRRRRARDLVRRLSMQRAYIRDGAEIYRRSFAIIRAESDLARFTPAEERGGGAHHPCLRHGRDRARHRHVATASPTMRAGR